MKINSTPLTRSLYPRLARLALLATMAAAPLCSSLAGLVETIKLRSGYDEGPPGGPLLPGALDTNITYTSGPAGAELNAGVLDFLAARSGSAAVTIAPFTGFWNPTLSTDLNARWINSDAFAGSNFGDPHSVLYAVPFTIQSTDFTSVKLDFSWLVDDALGDPAVGSNPYGVFIGMGTAAGVAVTPTISGGAFSGGPSTSSADITNLVQTGQNYMYIYQRDGGFVVSGTIFSADITAVPEPSTWAFGLGLFGICAGSFCRKNAPKGTKKS